MDNTDLVLESMQEFNDLINAIDEEEDSEIREKIDFEQQLFDADKRMIDGINREYAKLTTVDYLMRFGCSLNV